MYLLTVYFVQYSITILVNILVVSLADAVS